MDREVLSTTNVTDKTVKWVSRIVFGLPLLLLLAWLVMFYFLVMVLGRPDLCPANLC